MKKIILWQVALLVLSSSVGKVLMGDVKVRFFPNDQLAQRVLLENNALRVLIRIDRGIFFQSFHDKKNNVSYIDSTNPAPVVDVNNTWHLLQLGFNLWTVKRIESKETNGVEIRYFSNYLENANQLIVRMSLGETSELSLDIKVKSAPDSSRHDLRYLPRPSLTTGLSFLKFMNPDKSKKPYVIFKKGLVNFHNDTNDVGMYFLRQLNGPVFPTVVSYPAQNAGLLLYKEYSDLQWSFNTADEALSFMQLTPLKLGDSIVVFKGILKPFKGDWHEAFFWWRDKLRGLFDFTAYRRNGHQAYRKKIIGNFTMVFDHEFYDPINNTYRLNDFLQRGKKEFGGYDFFLFWHAYPRIGIDSRDQWDMYQGLPGGLDGLKELVQQANKESVWVMLSYNPWDVIGKRANLIDAQVEIMSRTGANGTYLDILRGADPELKDKFYKANPDLVFSSENRPSWEGLQMSTGSQEDHDYVNQMPRLDLLKFVIPEHNISNTERASRNRTGMIRNALFNFVGLTVWEDVFGEINRYSWDERILIHRYNKVVHDYIDAFLDTLPTPLVSTRSFIPSPGKDPFVTSNPTVRVWFQDPKASDYSASGLYVNAFHGEEKIVFSLYHRDHDNIDRYHDNRPIGKLFKVQVPDDWHAVNVWDGMPAGITKENNEQWITVENELPDASCVFAIMPKTIVVEQDNGIVQATVPHSTKGTLRIVEMDTEHRRILSHVVSASRGLKFVQGDVQANVYGFVMVQYLENEIVRDVVAIKVK